MVEWLAQTYPCFISYTERKVIHDKCIWLCVLIDTKVIAKSSLCCAQKASLASSASCTSLLFSWVLILFLGCKSWQESNGCSYPHFQVAIQEENLSLLTWDLKHGVIEPSFRRQIVFPPYMCRFGLHFPMDRGQLAVIRVGFQELLLEVKSLVEENEGMPHGCVCPQRDLAMANPF